MESVVAMRNGVRDVLFKRDSIFLFTLASHGRRERISTDLFNEIVYDPTHRLESLLPQRKSCKYALRCKRDFTFPKCKTERLKKSFIFSHVYNM
mgnify:CR=1 FL=1